MISFDKTTQDLLRPDLATILVSEMPLKCTLTSLKEMCLLSMAQGDSSQMTLILFRLRGQRVQRTRLPTHRSQCQAATTTRRTSLRTLSPRSQSRPSTTGDYSRRAGTRRRGPGYGMSATDLRGSPGKYCQLRIFKIAQNVQIHFAT